MSDNGYDQAPGWDEFRRQMPVVSKWTYLDHAAVAPLSGPAGRAIVEWCGQAVTEGIEVWSDWCRRVEEVRQTAASLIGAAQDEIALVQNTTHGINLVAEGYPWRAGDNVVTLDNEFPSNLYPWMNLENRGVQTRRVVVDDGRVDLDQLAEACDQRTRVVSVSWVGYASGWRSDVEQLARMAHDQGALLFLDAIQGLGVFPMDVATTGVDFLSADGHKWLLGPEGAGLFFMRREHLDRLRPHGLGWNSVVHQYDFTRIELNLRQAAARFEGGSQNMAGMIGLGASLDLLTAHGLSRSVSPIAERILEIANLAADRLERLGARIVSDRSTQNASGIVAFELPGIDPVQVRRECMKSGVALSCRGGWLRISPHAYNNDEDIDRLIQKISTLFPRSSQ